MSSFSSPSADGHPAHLPALEAQAFEDYFATSSSAGQQFPGTTTTAIPDALGDQSSYQTIYTSAGPITYGVDLAPYQQQPSISPSSSISYHHQNLNNSIYQDQVTSDRLAHPPHFSGTSLSSVNYDQSSLLSPTAAGYASDNAYSEISEHTTPSFDEDILGAEFGAIPSLDEGDTFSTPSRVRSSPSQDHLINGPPSSHASFRRKRSSQETVTNSSHLMSPGLTETSSPSSRDEEFRHLSMGPNPLSGSASVPVSGLTSGNHHSRIQISVPNLQNTPASTGSSFGGDFEANQDQIRPNIASPIVRVENYSRNESPARDALRGESLSKRRFKSPGHLSPHDIDEFSDDEMENEPQDEYFRSRSVSANGGRAENGSWIPSVTTGQAGVDPSAREQLQDFYMPSLKEQEEHRHIAEKNADVEFWLARSAPGSEAGDAPPSTLSSRRSKSTGKRRRAKSMGDPCTARVDALRLDVNQSTFDDSEIPGPGVLIDEDSEDDEGDDEIDGSSDNDADSVQSSPAGIDLNQPGLDESPSYFPSVAEEPSRSQFRYARPWNDSPFEFGSSNGKAQPITSNAAIMRFRQRADNIETSSRVATWGTRRMSETDLDKLLGPNGLLKRLSFGKDKEKIRDNEKEKRKGSLLDRAATKLLPKRSGSNLKRKPSQVAQRKSSSESLSEQPKKSMERPRKESLDKLAPPRRMSSFGRQKSLKLNTGGAVAAMAGQIAAIGGTGSVSATAVAPPSGPWTQAKNVIKRSRSRSELTRISNHSNPGLMDLMTQHGGPPMAVLASPPLQEKESATQTTALRANEEEDDDEAEDGKMNDKAVAMDLKVRPDPIVPNFDGFRTNVRQLNPRLVTFLIERISQEQIRRYKKLIDFKVKHLSAVKNRHCSSGKYCFALGGEAKILPPRVSTRDPETSIQGFQVATGGDSEDEPTTFGDGAVAAAQFPHGVPLPPVKRLPAEFECPLCFKVKKFQKPSDWTKHVHEDVQPFTCTFANCAEPKSFKRKADWVRHENERHRQLEWWTCNMPDCSHTCYRKDNFVQHLVREHKKPEPKVKATKAAKAAAVDRSKRNLPQRELIEDRKTSVSGHDEIEQGGIDQVWLLVEECRHDTPKQPRDEPCKFCGNVCSSWKKLTVHLAKHMEQISMPILGLIEKKNVTADTVISPIENRLSQQHHLSPQTPLSNLGVAKYSNQASNMSPSTGNLDAYGGLQTSSELQTPSTYHPTDAPFQTTGNFGAPQSTIFTPQPPSQGPEMAYHNIGSSDHRAASYPPFEHARQFAPINAGANYIGSRSNPYDPFDSLDGLTSQPPATYSSTGTALPSFENQLSGASATSYTSTATAHSGYEQQTTGTPMAGYDSGGTSVSPYEQQGVFASPTPVDHNPYAFQPTSAGGIPGQSLGAPMGMPYNQMGGMLYTQAQVDHTLAYIPPQQQQQQQQQHRQHGTQQHPQQRQQNYSFQQS
ncbi:MAG: hypothetical protein M1812_006686 [Candelaria pacifica]|nr:MAG: hypothetical protein M1812_006686 [Candelaria pacifica]